MIMKFVILDMQYGKEITNMSKQKKMVMLLIGSILVTGCLYDIYLPLMFSMIIVDIILVASTVCIAETEEKRK